MNQEVTEVKTFKDPIYGYIEIENALIAGVVDTAVFQRLRDVVQTSYTPLYSSAVHTRFAHSLGVYYLGRMASGAFLKSFREISAEENFDIKELLRVFMLACLLHDVGHAPFSHTGEKFYLGSEAHKEFHQLIVDLVNDPVLEKEIVNESYKAAPHELMSVIVSLREFGDLIGEDHKSFFARCVLGYKYTMGVDNGKGYQNCLIELLNSKIIDVDKLDYLIRDSYMTGYDTVKIDYVRLLNNICIHGEGETCRICYRKAALSVIENVVYAHDSERKWIQKHPVVLYEAYIVENMIRKVMDEVLKCDDKIAYEYLTEQGQVVDGYGTVRLLGDSDILFLAKTMTEPGIAGEYYNRNARKHPFWKSEAEFHAIFEGNDEQLDIIEEEFAELETYFRTLGLPFILNQKALEAIEKEIEYTEKVMGNEEGKQQTLKMKQYHLEWMRMFRKYAYDQNIGFDFLVISTEQFNSGFKKTEFNNIEVVFPEIRKPSWLNAVSNVLKAGSSEREKFFFLFYSRKEKVAGIKISGLVTGMLKLANQKKERQEIEIKEEQLN